MPVITGMRDLLQEIRLALRTLRKSPLFSAMAVLSLALGIGANTAIFSLANQILLRLLPVVKNPEQLVLLEWKGPFYGSNTGGQAISYPLYRDLRDRNHVFQSMFCRYLWPFSFGYGGTTERVDGEFVSGNYFPVLGVKAAVGRTFSAQDDLYAGTDPVAVLSHRFWKERFGGDPAVLGRQIRVNGRSLTVVGVVEQGFDGDELAYHAKIFVPLHMKTALVAVNGPYNYDDRRGKWVQVYGRLKPGITAAQAQAGLQPLFKSIVRWETTQPGFPVSIPEAVSTHMRAALEVHPAANGRGGPLRSGAERPIVVLMCAAGFVLLIACANIANLLLVRAAARQQEIAVRLALGAGRRHIIRQLLVESLLLAAGGGALGVALAWVGARALIASLPVEQALENFSAAPDLRVLVFALALTLLAGVLSGLAPAIQTARLDLNAQLKSEGRTTVQGGQAARRGLVVAQVFLSVLLLIGAGLFLRSLRNLRTLDPGFNAGNTLVFSVDPTLNGYPAQRSLQFYRELDQRLRALPGVDNAGLALVRLLSQNEWDMGLTVEGYHAPAGKSAWAYFNSASPDLLPTLGVRLLAGRYFNENDLSSPHKVAIVNQTFVDKYFGKQNPVGRHFGQGLEPGTKLDMEIVGVIANTKYRSLQDDDKENEAYWVPYTQMDGYAFDMTAYVKTRQDPERIASAVRRLVRELDPNVPLYSMVTFERQMDQSLALERLMATLASGFGALATLLAAVGLYGVLAFNVGQRTREIGIRMALGARSTHVTWMVMRDVLLLVGVGVLLALPASYALSKLVQSQLYGIRADDPWTAVLAALLLAAVGGTAGYLPARRASRVDPVQALKYE